MMDLRGKTAVVTGAGSGVGRGMARMLAREGVNVAVLDVNGDHAKATAADLADLQVRALPLELDVSDRAAMYRAADTVEREFGKIHILCNNAGIGSPRMPVEETSDGDIDWIFGVNAMGVLNGVKAFVPRIKRHGEGGHVVNTASIAGLYISTAHMGLYTATKMAVVAISQHMRDSLRPAGIGVSVLCPAAVNTNILKSGRSRPERYGGPTDRDVPAAMVQALATGTSPDDIGRCVVYAIKDGEMLYILPHGETRQWIADRNAALMAAYDRNARMLEELGLATATAG